MQAVLPAHYSVDLEALRKLVGSESLRLAREAEICYATMAHITDYDVWHESEAPVTVEMVIRTLNRNTELAQESIRQLVKDLRPERHCDCKHALSTALITRRESILPATLQKLDLLVNKYL